MSEGLHSCKSVLVCACLVRFGGVVRPLNAFFVTRPAVDGEASLQLRRCFFFIFRLHLHLDLCASILLPSRKLFASSLHFSAAKLPILDSAPLPLTLRLVSLSSPICLLPAIAWAPLSLSLPIYLSICLSCLPFLHLLGFALPSS